MVGIVTLVINIPVLRVDTSVPAVIVSGVTPSSLNARAVETGKLEPVIVTSVPAIPVAGEKASRAGADTIRVALASTPVSVPVEAVLVA